MWICLKKGGPHGASNLWCLIIFTILYYSLLMFNSVWSSFPYYLDVNLGSPWLMPQGAAVADGRRGSRKHAKGVTCLARSCYPLAISHSYGKWSFIVDFSIKDSVFLYSYVELPEGSQSLPRIMTGTWQNVASAKAAGSKLWMVKNGEGNQHTDRCTEDTCPYTHQL